MRKYLRLSELIWASLAFLCFSIVIFFLWKKDYDSAGLAMLVTGIATIMYLMRRRFNRILKRMDDQNKKEGN